MTLRGYEAQLAALKEFDSQAWVSKITAPVLVTISDQDLVVESSQNFLVIPLLPLCGRRWHAVPDEGVS